jgi:hypothetical protein
LLRMSTAKDVLSAIQIRSVHTALKNAETSGQPFALSPETRLRGSQLQSRGRKCTLARPPLFYYIKSLANARDFIDWLASERSIMEFIPYSNTIYQNLMFVVK